jgi:hypothetical protein
LKEVFYGFVITFEILLVMFAIGTSPLCHNDDTTLAWICRF